MVEAPMMRRAERREVRVVRGAPGAPWEDVPLLRASSFPADYARDAGARDVFARVLLPVVPVAQAPGDGKGGAAFDTAPERRPPFRGAHGFMVGILSVMGATQIFSGGSAGALADHARRPFADMFEGFSSAELGVVAFAKVQRVGCSAAIDDQARGRGERLLTIWRHASVFAHLLSVLAAIVSTFIARGMGALWGYAWVSVHRSKAYRRPVRVNPRVHSALARVGEAIMGDSGRGKWGI